MTTTQPEQQAADPKSRSAKMRDAGFTARDTRLECDECGKRFTRQFLPTHECEAREQAASDALTDELSAIVSFLLGEAPLHGVWFGDSHPDGKYWWRKALRAALSAGKQSEHVGTAARFQRLYSIVQRTRWTDYGVPHLEGDSKQAMEDLCEFLFDDGWDTSVSSQQAHSEGER